ncbi:hypothetical protein E0D81_22065 [Lelliottia amnigena]|nr:hypothetical protein E0D81_22065 [Lelliottia amnigena]
MAFTDVTARTAKPREKEYKLTDSHGLYLVVKPTGSKRWYLREALSVWLAAGEKNHYSAQDNDILTAIRFRPDAASRDDNREKYTHAQNENYVNKR